MNRLAQGLVISRDSNPGIQTCVTVKADAFPLSSSCLPVSLTRQCGLSSVQNVARIIRRRDTTLTLVGYSWIAV